MRSLCRLPCSCDDPGQFKVSLSSGEVVDVPGTEITTVDIEGLRDLLVWGMRHALITFRAAEAVIGFYTNRCIGARQAEDEVSRESLVLKEHLFDGLHWQEEATWL